MAKHNKKRNVGLIYEQLVRYASACVIADREKQAQKAISILTKHYGKGSQLYREWRLFNAIVNVPMGEKHLARAVLSESRRACHDHDAHKLCQEKSALIKDINYNLAEFSNIYSIRLPEYRHFATTQILLNAWRGTSEISLSESVIYENRLCNWIARKNESKQEHMQIDPLVLRIMKNKYKSKYAGKMSNLQNDIMEATLVNDGKILREKMAIVKSNCLQALTRYGVECNNKLLESNLPPVAKNIESFDPLNCSVENISKAMTMAEMISELRENDER